MLREVDEVFVCGREKFIYIGRGLERKFGAW
jgi:hypothetical protein